MTTGQLGRDRGAGAGRHRGLSRCWDCTAKARSGCAHSCRGAGCDGAGAVGGDARLLSSAGARRDCSRSIGAVGRGAVGSTDRQTIGHPLGFTTFVSRLMSKWLGSLKPAFQVSASEDRIAGTTHGMLPFLLRLVGAYRGRQGMQRGTKKVRITLWRQTLEYGDVEVTVPLNASLDPHESPHFRGTRKGRNLRVSALPDGESAGWGTYARAEGAI